MLPRPATMVTAVVVSFALAGVARLSSRTGATTPRDEESTPFGGAGSARLNSALYQPEIESLESQLYADSVPSMDDFTALSNAFRDVGFAIADRERNARNRDIASDVSVLAARADIGEAGYSLPDLVQLRSDWESLRSQRFSEAAWFRQSTPAIEESQAESTTTIDPAMADELLHAIDAIETLAQDGRRACDELGEPFYDLEQPGPAGDAHIEKWNAFARKWDDDVSRAATRLPSPPAWDADPKLTLAYQAVAGAIAELRLAAMGSGSWPIPFEREWTTRFDGAMQRLDQAREQLGAR